MQFLVLAFRQTPDWTEEVVYTKASVAGCPGRTLSGAYLSVSVCGGVGPHDVEQDDTL